MSRLRQGIGEPFVWLEGVSVWPSLVVRFVGFVTMLSLWYVLLKIIQQKEKPIQGLRDRPAGNPEAQSQ